MKGTIRGREKWVQGEDGQKYQAFAVSWKHREQYEGKRNDLRTYDVTFELEGGKIKKGTLELVPSQPEAPKKEKEREKERVEEKGGAPLTMAERRVASPVLVQIRALPLAAVQACTLFTLDRQEPRLRPRTQRELQEGNRECFASVEAFFRYVETDFAVNAERPGCLFCGNDQRHGSGAAQTFRQYYRLDEIAIRREELEIALQWKRDCTCNGWVFPHPPNNVFRRATDEEHETIVKRYDRAKEVSEHTGRRARDALLRVSGIDPGRVEDPKINHLVPKSGGGCPIGLANLQVHAALCPNCQKLDDLITRWQGEDKEYFRQQREEKERRLRLEEARQKEEQERQQRRAAAQAARAARGKDEGPSSPPNHSDD